MLPSKMLVRGFVKWRDEALKVLPLASIAGFVLMAWFLTDIFNRWGLSPAQLIVPSDVILPGLVLGVLAIGMIALAWSLGLIVETLLIVPERAKPYALAVLACATFPFMLNTFGIQAKGIAGLLAVGCFAYAAMRLPLIETSPGRVKVAFLVAIIPGLAWAMIALHTIQTVFVEHGFAGSVAVHKTTDTPCDGRVLWLGDKAIVIRCTGGASDIKVMTKKDGLTLDAP